MRIRNSSILITGTFLFLFASCQKTPQASFTYEIAPVDSAQCNNDPKCKDVIFTNTSIDAHSYGWAIDVYYQFGYGRSTEKDWTMRVPGSLEGIYTMRLVAYSKNGKKEDSFYETLDTR